MSAPLSSIHICSGVPLNSRYEHTIYFESASAQENYFMGKAVKLFTHYTYLRHSWSIKVSASMKDAEKWTYLFFKNPPSTKYYYYFIDRVEYINENTVELFLIMDVIQTYMFDYELLPCLVERQHTSTDEVGEHTIDEGIDTGELTTNLSTDVTQLNDLCVLICTSLALPTLNAEGVSNVYGISVDNMFSGLGWFAVSADKLVTLALNLIKLDDLGKTDGIFSMMMYPKTLVQIDDNDSWTDDTNSIFKQVLGTKSFSTITTKPTSVDGYYPKNKKLLCYPYNLLYVNNNQGGSAIFRYERFAEDTISFNVHGAIGEGSVRLEPRIYDNVNLNYENGLSLNGFPTCAWNSDTYKIWLAQNQNANQLQQIQNGLTIGAGMGTAIAGMVLMNPMMIAGGAGTAVSGVMSHSAQIGAMEDRKVQPLQACGTHSASVNTVAKKQTFTIQHKSVTEEHARIIDDYFTRYGYKINRVQVPNTNTRTMFTYVKTSGCNIRGDINNETATKICAVYDNGITFWKDGSKIGNYGDSNQPTGEV